MADTYPIYSIPEAEEWTIIIHKNTKMRSIAGRYKAEDDAFRFKVKPLHNPIHVETFTITCTDITTYTFNISLSWENVIVLLPVVLDVDKNVNQQIAKLKAGSKGIHDRDLFKAAEYNLHNSKDLNVALEYINEAMNVSDKNPRYGLLKAKIENAKGDKVKALATIQTAHLWATEQGNQNYIGQTKLFWDSLK